jgi:hypothetical protein
LPVPSVSAALADAHHEWGACSMTGLHDYLAGLPIAERGKLTDRILAGVLATTMAARALSAPNSETTTVEHLRYYLQMTVHELQAALESLPGAALVDTPPTDPVDPPDNAAREHSA